MATRPGVGPECDKTSQPGPLVTAEHRASVIKWIETGVAEGAQLVLDGRAVTLPGYEHGFYLGPTILDHVKPGMTVGDREVFGPRLCVNPKTKHAKPRCSAAGPA